ncbi:hypothetical protein RZS08_19005, partial [Arthrospira platensis SPKY1]|nr:hypothetical protein [Arthrospira platensis SPKY1]
RGDEHADVAVSEDVADLLRFENRVDRHGNATAGAAAEDRDHGLEALFQPNRDALAPRKAELTQTARQGFDLCGKRAVAKLLAAERQRDGAWVAIGSVQREIVEQMGLLHAGGEGLETGQSLAVCGHRRRFMPYNLRLSAPPECF